MGSFGDRLRREREMRGISLDDIAEATKIGTRLLRALEQEHFDLLPGGIFNKGFVRAYAKYLGLNEDEAVADYLQAAGESNPDPRIIAEQNEFRIDRAGGDSGGSRMAGFPIIPVLILLIVIAAGMGGWRIYQDRMRQRQAKADAAVLAAVPATQPSNAQTASAPGPATAAPASSQSGSAGTKEPASPTATNAPSANSPQGSEVKPIENPKTAAPGAASPQSTAAKPDASTAQTFEVAVRAKDRAWVSIRSDGKFAVRGIIAPPDIKTVHATDQVVFWTGNAGAVEISFNGQRIALEGGPNTEGTLVFNSRGVVIPRPAIPSPQR